MEEIERLKRENEMLKYWLLQSYKSFRRTGWEEGRSDDEICDCLISVLANMGLDPNSKSGKKFLAETKERFYV